MVQESLEVCMAFQEETLLRVNQLELEHKKANWNTKKELLTEVRKLLFYNQEWNLHVFNHCSNWLIERGNVTIKWKINIISLLATEKKFSLFLHQKHGKSYNEKITWTFFNQTFYTCKNNKIFCNS